MKTLFFSFVILLSSSFGFTNSNTGTVSNCTAPANLTIISQTQNSVDFDWDNCGCSATEYRIFFAKNSQVSGVYPTSKSDISFSGLSAGTYQFHFYTVCGSEVSSIIIEEIIIG